MLIGEVIKTAVSLRDTSIRKLAKKTNMSYQTIYQSCSDSTKQGMRTTNAAKLLDALDYQLVAIPKGTPLKDEWLKIDDTSEGVHKINRTCVLCGKAIPREAYSQVTPLGRVCEHCINERFEAEVED